MSPVDNAPTMALTSQNQNSQMIPMSTLIDFGVQRTYHELTILSELLPRKTDLERKIEIVQFASRTRQLFIRLLALVKWANSARKVDRCSEICTFLEQQSVLFIDTADSLARMSRETLVNARLPNFSLPCAVDVLTTGTYPRLPACIREKIVPPNPISSSEKRDTLNRLKQVIEYRLVASELPVQMRRLRVDNGRVKFIVEHEFEATLTLMGDSSTIPWRLLDINFLVRDHDTGHGKNLVHSLQVHYIHQLLQCLLLENERPLHDLYQVLHSFCQSLQLEVLHSQTQRLMGERLGDNIRVEDYTVGQCLVVSYWRQLLKKEDKSGDLPQVYKVSVHIDGDSPSKPLTVNHSPALSSEDSARVGLAIKSDQLSLEKLLVHTIEVRSLTRLKDLAKDMRKFTAGRAEIRDMPPVLCVPLFSPCLSCEILRIGVDIQRGTYLVSMISYDDPSIREIQDTLNTDRKNLEKAIFKLRQFIAVVRCKKSLQHIPAQCYNSLPILNMADHSLQSIASKCIYVSVPRQLTFYVVIHMDQNVKGIDYKYYLLEVTSVDSNGDSEDTGTKAFLRAGKLIPMNTFAVTHGPFTKVLEDRQEMDSMTRKRKLLIGDITEPIKKKPKISPYFNPDIAYLVTHCEERIPFAFLVDELNKQGVPHSGVQVDGEGVCLSLTITGLPDITEQSTSTRRLRQSLVSCTFRIVNKPLKNFLLEFVFCDALVTGKSVKEQGPVHRVYFLIDVTNPVKVVDTLISEWNAISKLFALIYDFSLVYNSGSKKTFPTLEVLSYDYKHLVLAYGVNSSQIMSVFWRSSDQRFHLQPSVCGQSPTSSCHIHVLAMLEDLLNHSRSLSLLAQILCETAAPLTAISKLSTATVHTVTSSKSPVMNFTVLPQTPTHIRIAYRKYCVLDVNCKGGNLVGVRDGAYSLFDTSKVIDGFTPIPGLKAFLNLFVDESVFKSYGRQRSNTDDDNPPSPIGMDSIDNIFMTTQSTGSPATRIVDTMRFPMTPPSNPHTPASPSTTKLPQQPHGYSSPASAFPLTSPPSIPPHPSPAQLIGTPSPAQLLSVGSPSQPHLHVPSPGFGSTQSPANIHMQSPATSFLASQGADSGSPFPGSSLSMPAPSPISRLGTTMSPGYSVLHSPQTHKDSEHKHPASIASRVVSRFLPQRSWAASVPTLLSHDAFTKLLSPTTVDGLACSPLEKFLGCVYCRRHIQRFVNTEELLTAIQSTESGVLMFKVETLQLKVSLHPNTLQSLHLEATPLPEFREQWTSEQLQTLERYFESRVACVPYRLTTIHAFLRIVGTPMRILKDCIQIMRDELSGPDRNVKWSVQFCLTIPHGTNLMPLPGTTAFVYKNQKMFLVLQFNRVGMSIPPGTDPHPIIAPLTYDNNTNTLSLMEPKAPPGAPPGSIPNQSPALATLSLMLKRAASFHHQSTECMIYPAICEIINNLVVPV